MGAAEGFEQLTDSASMRRASSSSPSGPRRRRDGVIAGAISMRAVRDESDAATAAGNTGTRCSTAGSEQPRVAAADVARIERPAQAEHEDLTSHASAPAISSGRASSPPRRRAKAPNGAVSERPTKRNGSTDVGAQRHGDPPLGQAEAARVDDDHRRSVARAAAPAHRWWSSSADAVIRLGDPHERVVAAPVVDVPRRQQATRRRPRERLQRRDRRRQATLGKLDHVAHQATCRAAGWRTTDGQA